MNAKCVGADKPKISLPHNLQSIELVALYVLWSEAGAPGVDAANSI